MPMLRWRRRKNRVSCIQNEEKNHFPLLISVGVSKYGKAAAEQREWKDDDERKENAHEFFFFFFRLL